jgi:two-component system LytT family response regulator
MPEKNGFEVLQELTYMPHVVFVTAYDEYALKAFEVNALDYLMKPIDEQRLEATLNKIKKNLNQIIKQDKYLPSDKIFIKDGEKCWFIELSKVRMLESEGNYVKVYFDNFRPLILRSLNSFEDRLDPEFFFRANRKFIINLQWVSKVENWFNGGLQVELREGEKIEVSRRQAIRFKEMLSL